MHTTSQVSLAHNRDRYPPLASSNHTLLKPCLSARC